MSQKVLQEQQKLYNKKMPLVEKWSDHIEVVNETLSEDGSSMHTSQQVVLATCLENLENRIKRAENMYETTQPSDIGPFKKFGLEILTAVVPNMIINDLVSVQPMDNRVGEIRYVKYLYGDDKGSVSAGDEITSAKEFSGGNWEYSSEEVTEEVASVDGFSGSEEEWNLAWTPIRPGTVKLTWDGGEITDDGDGKLEGDNISGDDNVIDYESGEITIDGDSSTSEVIYAEYRADFETAPVTAPRVSLKIATLPIIAKTRKLTTLYSFDAAFDLQQDYIYSPVA